MSTTETGNGLKRVGFVPEAGTKGYEIASQIYTTAKGYVPATIQPTVTKVEETMTNATAPYLAVAQDKSVELLKVVDVKVSSLLCEDGAKRTAI
jgi:IMP dehydrogenase/GMP reductase